MLRPTLPRARNLTLRPTLVHNLSRNKPCQVREGVSRWHRRLCLPRARAEPPRAAQRLSAQVRRQDGRRGLRGRIGARVGATNGPLSLFVPMRRRAQRNAPAQGRSSLTARCYRCMGAPNVCARARRNWTGLFGSFGSFGRHNLTALSVSHSNLRLLPRPYLPYVPRSTPRR